MKGKKKKEMQEARDENKKNIYEGSKSEKSQKSLNVCKEDGRRATNRKK